MRILGVDPGYKNLGLALVDLEPSGAHVVWSKSMSVGSASNGLNFCKFLWPRLDELYAKYGIDGISSETPPFIMTNIKTTALLWAVSSIISCWGYSRGIPFRHASPMTLKKAVCRALNIPYDKKKIPKKRAVKQVVQAYTGSDMSTSHENDAALSAILLYSNLIPS